MPDSETTTAAFSLLEQMPLLGIFVLALGLLLWIERHWHYKETVDWRTWTSGERKAFEAALLRVSDSHKEGLSKLGMDISEALSLLRETIRDLSREK